MASDKALTLHILMAVNDNEPIEVGEIEFPLGTTYQDFTVAMMDMFGELTMEIDRKLSHES